MFKFLNRFRHFDVPLIAATLLLVFAGSAILYGTTLSDSSKAIFYRQLIFLALGLGAFIFISFFDYHILAKANRLIYIIILAVLAYTLLFGFVSHGSRRWLNLGLGSFQAAEFAKLSVILGLARLLYLKRGQINSWQTIIWS